MKFLQAYITQWGKVAVIEPAKCLGRFCGCLPGCPVVKCGYKGRV